MQCAHERAGSKLKRFVLLGSAVSMLNSFEDMSVAGKNYTEKDWNPVTAKQAVEENNPVLAHGAGKKLAEEAAWRFMEENKPTYDLTVTNPVIIIGPMLQKVSDAKSVNESIKFPIYDFINGTYTNIEDIKFPFYHFVDVRDVARAHVIAMTKPSAAGQRVLLVAGEISPQLVVNIIRKRFPEMRQRVMEGVPDQFFPKGVYPTGWDTSRSLEILGGPSRKYIDLEESVADTVKCLLELEKAWSK